MLLSHTWSTLSPHFAFFCCFVYDVCGTCVGEGSGWIKPISIFSFSSTPPLRIFYILAPKIFGLERYRGGLTRAGLQDLFNLSQFPFDIIWTERSACLVEVSHTGLWMACECKAHECTKNEWQIKKCSNKTKSMSAHRMNLTCIITICTAVYNLFFLLGSSYMTTNSCMLCSRSENESQLLDNYEWGLSCQSTRLQIRCRDWKYCTE